ncbi:hypothetical protein LPJ78_005045 [Coemansia sp. RSA 989]|nr:hypothetical protein BX667DRAFT_93962 [Coemansia mojavensis]KAJ1739384.1 hypothetical protein LPJ68_004740 [Coemansia sp. RSA 1086]KAJ1747826.1 hypothetical protein LPJ79_004986 [Coemansia sp. RSA 1821]KAJ1861910.1 hypothetical protein LPJ78_005045 [Coemansia sp. RSA 989]KAJ1869830.1 hypothetical protein LPJ55_005104 [Coemansia sp. RSA 990]KAJ2631907.1 hypothetical protein H4R22_001640 [Coemansia sp. RSA 1290]KAJ2653070.1 hypothetical protein IWW40_000724 [Coemansia sp. RSA 1250]KAJ267607
MEYDIKGASEAQNKLVREISDKFGVHDEHLVEIAEEVHRYLTNGLNSDDEPMGLPSRVSYIKSEITDDIREAKKNGSVALGLTITMSTKRMKVASIKFSPGAPDIVNKQVFHIKDGMTSATQLCEEAATHIAQFINSHDVVPAESLRAQPISLGVSIDLPMEETSKSGGRVVCDSRACDGFFRNVDIAQCLNAALLKQHLPVKVTSTTNCVISTMVAAQHHFQATCTSLILNHGINASYYELARKIPKISGSELGNSMARVAINTELAKFGENSQIIQPTMWDHRIDRESGNTGYHIFEKLVADKYLGEIVRNLITDFMDARLIFPKNADVSTFSEPYSFFTSYMTIMEDTSDDLSEVGNLLKAGFNIDASHVDRQIVRSLCHIVSMRAAKLVGGAVAGVIKKATEAMDEPEPAVVSISGQLTEMNQPYVKCTVDTAKKVATALKLPEPVFNILGEDGYTVGAALSSFSK